MDVTDAELAIAAAQAGAAVVRSRYRGELSRIAKSPTDFATEVDLASENAVIGLLRTARPGDRFVGEESGESGSAGSERVWLIDPLCGTLNYAAGTPLASVNVALRAGERVVAAASADPIALEVFWTDGQAAYVRHAGSDQPLEPTPGSLLVEVNLDPPHPNEPGFTAARLVGDPALAVSFRPRVVSTTLALAWVAAGRRAAYVTDGHLRDNVHFAAGIAVCQAAGCIVTGLNGQPVHTGIGGLVVAADRQTHEELVRLIDGQRRTSSVTS